MRTLRTTWQSANNCLTEYRRNGRQEALVEAKFDTVACGDKYDRTVLEPKLLITFENLSINHLLPHNGVGIYWIV